MHYITRYISLLLCVFLSAQGTAQQRADTLRLYFDLGDPTLTRTTTQKIDSWLYHDIIGPKQNILIVGYADHLGGRGYNDTLSANRAANVQDYLLNMGIRKERIKMLVGKGEVLRKVEKRDGYPTDRRVDIILPRNNKPSAPPIATAAPARTPETPATPGGKIEMPKPGQTMVLSNIYFYRGRHFVKEESLPELDRLYNALRDNPGTKIQIEGHVCCVRLNSDALDEDTFEMALSENRAKYIYYYLIKKGISKDRLHYRGFGKSRPLVEDERTPEDEARNRRVEIRVLEN